MKCPKCKGYGIIGSAVPDILRGRGAIFSSNECDMCHGSGEVPMTKPHEMTNEDWLRSCTTDEMVKTILDLCDYRPCFACGIGYCDDEDWCHVYSDKAKEFVVEWLKQPHTTEER